MPTLIATAASATANSYITQADATTYHDERLNTTDWTGATSDNKDRALIMATRLLDHFFDWEGEERTDTQALRWPRTGVETLDGRNVDYDTIPAPVAHATAEYALFLLKFDRLADPDLLGQGFSAAKVGSLDVTVDQKQVLPFVPKHITAMLRGYGSLSAEASRGGDKVVRLWRA